MLNTITDNFLFFDGAMGTMLQNDSLKPGQLPEVLNIINSELIAHIHRQYLNAGSHIITANTFGANRLKLRNSGYSAERVINSAVEIAKKSVEGFKNKFIALDIGPIGTLLSPLGTLGFDEAYDIFKEQVTAGVNAGADIILIETMTDIYEVKAALLAAKENSDLPVFCTMSFQNNNRTFTGTDVATFVSIAEGLGADALGANCSLGPKELQSVVDEFLKYSSTPVIIQANAGLPSYRNGRTHYDINADEYADEINAMAKKGVSIFGGCCGTTPEYIKNMIHSLRELKPVNMTNKRLTTASSSTKTVFFGNEIKIIGERINPTGKKEFKEALRKNNYDLLIKEAILQQDTGCDLLDVNVGIPDIDEKEVMKRAVEEIQSVISLPLQIDSSNPKAIEAAVRIYNGKPVINSVNGKKESIECIFPIAKKYGTLVVALTLDENGIPKTAEERLKIASRIVETAADYGIPEENILIDPLVLTASAEQASVMETLKSIPLIKNRYNVKTVLGISNISFGLPKRNKINAVYLSMALGFGLDAPIADSCDEGIMDAIRAFKILSNQDKDSKNFISHYGKTEPQNSTVTATHDLKDIIVKGIKDEAKNAALKLLDEYSSIELINRFLIPALDAVGEKYEHEEIFLPQLIRSAETAKEVFSAIKSEEKQNSSPKHNKILLATVKGDIHDIGKNIVKLLLENYGYEIIDLGKDVNEQSIVDAAVRENIKLVGLSALMTTTVSNMETAIKLLKHEIPSIKIMAGGAVLTKSYALKIGADYYARDARGAVDIAKNIF